MKRFTDENVDSGSTRLCAIASSPTSTSPGASRRGQSHLKPRTLPAVRTFSRVGHHRRKSAATIRQRHYNRFAALDDRHARVGGAEVDTAAAGDAAPVDVPSPTMPLSPLEQCAWMQGVWHGEESVYVAAEHVAHASQRKRFAERLPHPLFGRNGPK